MQSACCDDGLQGPPFLRTGKVVNYNANSGLQYWDSITKEDLEFSVGTKPNNWEVKELLPEDERRTTLYHDGANSEYTGSIYHQSRNSAYGGFNY